METVVSVIVPVYNVTLFLDRCIESIISQTYTNLEIILVDDGSTDDSGIKCEEYSKIDKRIIVIHRENGGLSAARNTGIDTASGEYITFIDSDDWIEPNFVEALLKIAKEYFADVVQCSFNYLGDNSSRYNGIRNSGNIICMDQEKAIQDILINNHLFSSAWGKLYRMELFKDRRYPEGKLYEDIPVTYDILLHCNKTVYVDLNYYNYFFNQNSISKAKFKPSRLDAVEFINEACEKIVVKYPELKTECGIARFRTNMGVYYSFEKESSFVNEKQKTLCELKKYAPKVIFNKKTRAKDKMEALLLVLCPSLTVWLQKSIVIFRSKYKYDKR